MELATHESPQKISEDLDALTQHQIPTVSPEVVEEELRIQYAIYRRQKIPHPLLKKACRAFSKFMTSAIGFVHQFWREIVPEVIRGKMRAFSVPVSSGIKEKEDQFFLEFMKKRTPFFLIVFKGECTQEEVQQAYISATNILGQGLSVKQDELQSSTSYRHWAIRGIQSSQKYSIHVLKFDVFQKLVWFGTLSRGTLLAQAESTEFLPRFRREVDSAVKQYDKVEDSFLGSYVEKEDRFALDPMDEK